MPTDRVRSAVYVPSLQGFIPYLSTTVQGCDEETRRQWGCSRAPERARRPRSRAKPIRPRSRAGVVNVSAACDCEGTISKMSATGRQSDKTPVWNPRRYLPHVVHADVPIHVCFRLADSVPSSVIESWQDELAGRLPEERGAFLRARVDRYLDQGYGSCLLADDHHARVVADAIRFHDQRKYSILAWCVMPNHVHVLLELSENHTLRDIVHSWKSFTAHQINRRRGVQRTVWMADYFDRLIRNDAHRAATVAYIHGNPVRAGLVALPHEWPWSSAYQQDPFSEAGT